MGDGYFSSRNTIICTDNFTYEEVLKLKEILYVKFKIVSVIMKRINSNDKIMWRIKIDKLSMNNLREIVFPYFILEMYYKLGIK